MPTPTKGPRVGGSPAHERIIMANLATQLFEHGKVTTTATRAKRVQPLAEKLITKAKRGTLHDRRIVLRTVRDQSVVHQLFTDIAETMADREGGYTRVTRIGNRKGDNAPMAVIELVTEKVVKKAAAPETKTEVEEKIDAAAVVAADSTEVDDVDAAEATDEVDAAEAEATEEADTAKEETE